MTTLQAQRRPEVEATYSGVAIRSYADRSQADAAIRALQSAGFSNDAISVVVKDSREQRDLADEHHVGAGTGATIGVVEGAVIGLLAGVAGLVLPGIGAIAVAGPIAGLLAGGITGGIAGALAGWGIDKAEAKNYEERVAAGEILVAVRDDNPARVMEARRILDQAAGDTGVADIPPSAPGVAGDGMTPAGIGMAGSNLRNPD